MTLKQKIFVKAYLREGNATKAAIEAYKCRSRTVAASVGSENLRKPLIKQELQQAFETRGLTPEWVAEYLKQSIVSGIGNEATNTDSLKGIEIALKMHGLVS